MAIGEGNNEYCVVLIEKKCLVQILIVVKCMLRVYVCVLYPQAVCTVEFVSIFVSLSCFLYFHVFVIFPYFNFPPLSACLSL